MATLSVLKFDDPYGADRVLIALQGMQERQLITLEDAAVVSWPEGNKKPKTRQLHSTAGAGAGWGAFWGKKWAEKYLSMVRRATPQVPPRLFGRFLEVVRFSEVLAFRGRVGLTDDMYRKRPFSIQTLPNVVEETVWKSSTEPEPRLGNQQKGN